MSDENNLPEKIKIDPSEETSGASPCNDEQNEITSTSEQNNQYFDSIVLSGGGAKGLAQIGALDYYYTVGKYNHEHVKEYVGTSVGSIICSLLVCGYTPWEIFQCMYHAENFKILFDIMSIIKNYGILDIENILLCIKTLILQKFEHIPTLQELYEHTKKIGNRCDK